MIGQGYDCYFGVSGSVSGFGTLTLTGEKKDSKAKKKLLMDGGGATVGYKYYDFSQEITIDGWVSATSGNTGTIQPTEPSIGTTITVTGGANPFTGSWSLDSCTFNGRVEDALSVTINASRYTSTTIV